MSEHWAWLLQQCTQDSWALGTRELQKFSVSRVTVRARLLWNQSYDFTVLIPIAHRVIKQGVKGHRRQRARLCCPLAVEMSTLHTHRTSTFHSSTAELKRKQLSTMKLSCQPVLGLLRRGPTTVWRDAGLSWTSCTCESSATVALLWICDGLETRECAWMGP